MELDDLFSCYYGRGYKVYWGLFLEELSMLGKTKAF